MEWDFIECSSRYKLQERFVYSVCLRPNWRLRCLNQISFQLIRIVTLFTELVLPTTVQSYKIAIHEPKFVWNTMYACMYK